MSTHDPFGDNESDDDDFNPAQGDISGDEDSGHRNGRDQGHDDVDEEEERGGEGVDEEDEEEEDDEDEEEDEEDEDITTHRKRRKTDRNAFIDLEAEVDDEDEAEDDEADGEEIRDFIEANPDDPDEGERFQDDRHHRELDRRLQLETGVDLEQQADLYRQKYGKRHRKPGANSGDVLPKRLLLPSVEDPSIWAVKCKEGKEREVIFSIMKKVEESRGTNHEVHITSAFERGGPDSVMKGIIYVEAQRQNDIMLALDGMLNVYVHSKLHLVDIKEMPDLLRIKKTEPLRPGSWVRLRRPAKHNGDLAQVLDLTDNGLEARVKFIPRIDYGGSNTNNAWFGGKRKRFGGGPTPPQRLFSEAEARKNDARKLQKTQRGWIFGGDEFENGYQIKDIKIQLLQTQNVNPTLDEVTKFTDSGNDGTENLDLGSLAASLKEGNNMILYVPGDTIEVYEGEQKGVWGKATHVVGDIVTLKVAEGGLQGQSIEVPTRWLRKRFSIGDHVKVVGGSRFRDEVGMVVKIEQDRVTLLADNTSQEITVFSKDLREASDSGGQGSLGQYSLLDLVQLDAVTVGCIIKVNRESLGILDQNGDIRQVMPSQIAHRLPRRKMAVAADRNGAEIRMDDVVKEILGMHRQGKIIHIYRQWVFLHSNEVKENSGVFVTRSSNLTTVAAKGGRLASQTTNTGPDLTTMNPALQRLGGNQSKPMMPPKVIGRDKSIGQSVHIKKGGYKGLLGIVKDATDAHVRLELHAKNKVITVPKDYVIFKDKVTGERIDISRRGLPQRGGLQPPSSDRGWQGGRTPSVGRTPGWGSATPAHGSGGRTPAWSRGSGDGGRTPAWHDGSRTVNPYADGNRTAYGNSGGRTPAWSSGASGSKTPAHGDFGSGGKTPAYGGSDSWNSGSKTPAYGVSAPTPGASGGAGSGNGDWGYTPGAPTPDALNAPTPGAYSAPTPAAVSAPTPGAWQSSSWGGGVGADSAPTPAAGAPTPAAGGLYYGAPTPAPYAAETPAASGPRYDEN